MTRRRRVRPVAVLVAATVAAGVVAAVAARASSAPDLPPIAADRLVASTLRALAARPPVSGMLRTHVDLGLPSLPDEGPAALQGPAELLSYINGDHRLRLWSSRDGVRLAELLSSSELDYYLTRTDVWLWDAESFTAVHVGPFPQPLPLDADPQPVFDLVDPLALARRGLEALSPSTAVRVGQPVRVAGRGAYALNLEPRTEETLVGRVEIDIDAERRLPLRVAVFARGAGSPALSVGFSSVGFGPIPPDVYRFDPPHGARVIRPAVHEDRRGQGGASLPPPSKNGDPAAVYGRERAPRTFGAGWATVIAVPAPSLAEIRKGAGGFDVTRFLPFSGPLFSLRLVDRGDHGWLLFGTVPQSRLASVEPELT